MSSTTARVELLCPTQIRSPQVKAYHEQISMKYRCRALETRVTSALQNILSSWYEFAMYTRAQGLRSHAPQVRSTDLQRGEISKKVCGALGSCPRKPRLLPARATLSSCTRLRRIRAAVVLKQHQDTLTAVFGSLQQLPLVSRFGTAQHVAAIACALSSAATTHLETELCILAEPRREHNWEVTARLS